jgi:CRISPR-associated Csx2 family protein
MSKVFVSFLGTNNYVETKYRMGDGRTSDLVRFVQEALISLLCEGWTSNDRILIFCTSAARKNNWEDNGHGENEEGLKTRLNVWAEKRNEPQNRPTFDSVAITEGFTETDIWEMFNTVYNELNENDEIYLDVTHAFRSIPLFSIPLFNYAKFMKGTRLAGIYYGAFEALGPAFKVKEMDKDKRIAQIVDLTSLARLQETNVAASNFVEFGKVGVHVSGESDIVRTLNEQLELLDYYILTCNMPKLKKGDYYKTIKENIDTIINDKKIPNAEKELLKEINKGLEKCKFKTEEATQNIVSAIFWAINHNMIQQAYTLGEEYMQLRIAEYIYGRLEVTIEVAKKIASILLLDEANKRDYSSVSIPNEFINRIESGFENDFNIKEKKDEPKTVRDYYNVVRKKRNELNHAKGESRNGNVNVDRNAQAPTPSGAMKDLKETLRKAVIGFVKEFNDYKNRKEDKKKTK